MRPFALMSAIFWTMNHHFLLAITFNLLLFQHKRGASAALGNETDYLALLRFKESISNDPYGILPPWNSSSHFCNWHGVTCSPGHQRVTQLNLQGYGLHGFISPHVGNLSFLRNLNLGNNSFYGQIPQEMGRLLQLQQLSLTNNTLRGDIPANLTSCTQLRELSLRGNNLTGKIPIDIGVLRKLEVLYINDNFLTGPIPASTWNLSSLSIVSMAFNYLEGNIPNEVSNLQNLTFISVGANKLSGTLPPSLYNMSYLRVISAALNQFNGSLPASMFLTLPKLQSFEIGGNQISGPIPSSIANASVLERLDISVNQFVGQVPSLQKLQNIWVLSLSTNSLGENSTKDLQFLESMINCSNLRVLDITVNNFGGPLPNSIGNLSTQLNNLYLGGNPLHGKIPAALGNLINLSILAMEQNHLMGNIPATFGKLQKLQQLSLSVNKLSGEISPFIGNLSRLFQLDLSHNLLQGNIPPSIGNCQNLQYLDLSQNNFGGAIPSQVFGLSSLSILLNLSQNSLTSSLPAEVGSLKNIDKLDISKNRLSGDLPATIGDCISLEYLNLQGNSLQGIIPSSLASLKGLRHLDLSGNNFSGSIPESLPNISVLEYLNVSFNMLDGEVPTEGVFHNSSAISVTGNSKLCGGIKQLQLPPCPTNFLKHTKHHNIKLIVVITTVTVIFLMLSLVLVIFWVRKSNMKPPSDLLTIDKLSKVSYQRLYQATNGFATSNFIASGSFGSVYKGSLDSEDRDVAIKVLNLQKKGVHKSFIAECNALRNIRHRNLVKILTCCSSTDYQGNEFKALVFEYMINGSLEQWLHAGTASAEQPRILDLNQRLNIIIDVAFALHYLHHECEQPIVHCDLKPSNVLLDDDMVAHVSDFGLARLLSTINGISHKQTSTSGIKGTIGYAPPEYGMGSEVSTQGEMYSFGILVLEMLTGRRPTDEMFEDGKNLHNFVKLAFPGNLLQILDPTLVPKDVEAATEEENKENLTLNPKVEKCLVSLFRIGIACSVEPSRERMNMVDVTRELNMIRKSFFDGGINGD